jgi:hypothetical protein
VRLNRIDGLRVDVEPQLGRKPDGAGHADVILAKTIIRIPNGPEHFVADVLVPAHVIDHLAGNHISYRDLAPGLFSLLVIHAGGLLTHAPVYPLEEGNDDLQIAAQFSGPYAAMRKLCSLQRTAPRLRLP